MWNKTRRASCGIIKIGMGRCCKPIGAKRLLDEDQEGPRITDERHCTDVVCIILFVATMAVFALIGVIGVQIGDLSHLRYGEDHLGRQCGTGALAHLPKTYYPMLGRDLVSQRELVSTPWRLRLFGVCTTSCPARGDVVRDFGYRGSGWPVAESTLSVLNRCVPTVEETQTNMIACVEPRCEHVPLVDVECLSLPGHEGEGLWVMRDVSEQKYCLRQLTLAQTERYEVPGSGPLITSVVQAVSSVTAAAAEIAKAPYEVLLCGVGLAIVMGLGWHFLLRCCAGVAIWLILWSTVIALLASTAFCALKADVLGEHANTISAHAITLLRSSN